jgi:hypothetical protein
MTSCGLYKYDGQSPATAVASAKSREIARTVEALHHSEGVYGQNDKEDGVNELHDLSKALEQMGASAEEVAATLRATGVQRVRNTVRVLNP